MLCYMSYSTHGVCALKSSSYCGVFGSNGSDLSHGTLKAIHQKKKKKKKKVHCHSKCSRKVLH